MRVGIGRPPGRQDAADFVLKDFSATERKELDLLVVEAADAAELLLERGPRGRAERGPPPQLTAACATLAVARDRRRAPSGERRPRPH